MGYAQKRVGRDGKPRYTAVYHDVRGRAEIGRNLLQQEGRQHGVAEGRSEGRLRAA